MGIIIDFNKFKEGKIVNSIGFQKQKAVCPFCQAPTTIELTSTGTPIHTFNGEDMEAYKKLRELVITIVDYFKASKEGLCDDDLVEAFGEGMADFLKEQEGQK
jgi:hypothetical protein